jgi:hypothetical protein
VARCSDETTEGGRAKRLVGRRGDDKSVGRKIKLRRGAGWWL